MSDTTLGRRGLLLASGAVLAGAGAAARAEEKPRRLQFMVVGAHPDDPETGCGGTMARLADLGHEVVAAYLTRGEAGIPGTEAAEAARIRTAEAEKACEILGARSRFLGQIDGAAEVNAQRYEETRRVLADEKPDVVLCHWPVDTHRDHRAAALLTYDAWLFLGRPFALYYYEVMSGHQTQVFHPTHFVDIGATVKRKHEACFAHRSQKIEGGLPQRPRAHGGLPRHGGTVRLRRGLRAAPPEPRRSGVAPGAGVSGCPRPMSSTEPDDVDELAPFEGEDFEDSWEPPRPALGGPGQLLAAVVAAFVAALLLLGAVATVTWLFRLV